MPELPEVETIARELSSRMLGLSIHRVWLSRRDIVRAGIESLETESSGKRVIAIARRGKRIEIDLEPEGRLVFHLGMSGRITMCDPAQPLETHTHLRIGFGDGQRELRFRDPRRFGGVWFSTDKMDGPGRGLRELGAEPLELSRAKFLQLLARSRQIKALLLDQQAIAGLGNIYCDESLHAAGIHPLRRAEGLTREEGAKLLQSIKSTLRRAIRFRGTTLVDYRQPDGTEGGFRRHHRVYQREGEACRTCGFQIVRIIAAGRSTFLCSKCQPVSYD
ncbi:MAG: bifunctional DNA-formamidopyrimidine glycosylase/DNA-(apurinic or apyrimidinic site) lyase [Planctomycetota bacterium]